MKDFFQELKEDASLSLSADFTVNITDARVVPTVDDPGITFEDLDQMEKNCKEIETTVLYVDLRDSTHISNTYSRESLVKIYSTFITTAVLCIQEKGGFVRNIVGDRVMAVFHSSTCFEDSVNTAILLNTAVNYLLHELYPDVGFRCGIGIDYGTMLVTKTGIIKQGKENAPNRSLVWLGKPANVASKLTDQANKIKISVNERVTETHVYPRTNETSVLNYSPKEFIQRLSGLDSKYLVHKEEYFHSFNLNEVNNRTYMSPILITKEVYEGLKKENPNEQSIANNWWGVENLKINEYPGTIYGTDVFYKAYKEV